MKRSVFLVLIMSLLTPPYGSTTLAAEESVSVDLPVGNALDTLKQLAVQTELQLIYSSGSLAGVKTSAVSGEFSPGRVLELMFKDSPIQAVQDGETGAFAIVRRETGGSDANQTLSNAGPSNETINQTGMNQNNGQTYKLLRSFLRGFFAVATAAATPLVAQEDDVEGDVYVLTPFEVSSDDTGYSVTSTLAGSRLRMNLDDVGSSISVFTEQLMDDLGAVDNETLLAYGLGTEVGGVRGNFINPNTEGLENENLIDPQSNNRIRGLTNADTTRNFFKSDVPWDSYNTDRIDVQRGANSILFGLGSPAGIINNSTRSAGFYDSNEVQFSIDQFGSLRATGNFNRVLIEDVLAVRVDLLRDDKKFRQNPAFEDDERIHAALTWQPKGLNTESITTRISANFEHGEIKANRPRMVVPLDMVSSFFIPSGENGFEGADFANGGKFGPSSDIFGPGGRTYNPVADDEALESIPWLGVPPNGNPWPVFGFDDAVNPGNFFLYEEGINSEGSFLTLESQDGEETAVVLNNGAYVNPFATNANTTFIRGVNHHIFQAQQLSTIGKQRVANDNGLAFPGFWRDPSLSSTDQFDYVNNLIDGNNKLEQQNFDVFELNLRNTYLDNRVGYQLSYFKQDLDFRQDANLGAIFAPSIQVEANSTHTLSPDPNNLGANPTAGRAYIDYELRLRGGTEDIRNRESKQAQLFATLDTRDFMEEGLLTKILGKHDFTGLFKNQEFERFRREFNSTGVDEQTIRTFGFSLPDDPDLNPNFDARNTDPGPGARMGRLSNAFGSVQPRIRVYLDSQGPNLTQLQPFTDPVVPSGTYSIMGFQATPRPGFTAVEAAQPWVTPTGDDSFQASNPINYVGTVVDKGPFTVVKATDSDEALEYLTQRRFYDLEDVDTQAFVWTGTFWDNALVGMYGWREDKVKQYSLEHDFNNIPENNIVGRTGGPVFDPDSPFARLSQGEFQSRNWSVKLNASQAFFDLTGMDGSWLPFHVSFLYNEGEVQNPQPGRRDVLLNDLDPATGTTIDRSIAISSKDGRYSLRVTKYDTVQANANAGSVAASENWRIEQVISNSVANGVVWIEEGRAAWTDAVLDNGDEIDDPNEINPTRSQEIRDFGFDSPLAWGQSIAAAYRAFENELFTRWPATNSWITSGAPGTNQIGINFPDDTVFIEDNQSFGMEYEFTARLTDNWNLMLNASKTEVLRSKVFGDEVNEVLDFIVENLNGAPGQVPLWGPEGQMGQARVAPFLGQLITNRALLGTPTGELRKWKFNLVTGYDFTEGTLQGFGIGGGFRYEDSQVVGFPPRYVDPVTGEPLPDSEIDRPDRALSVDIDRPFKDDNRTTADLWLKYNTKLTDKIDWRIQLNVYNVFDDKGTVPLFVNPDGTFGTLGIREGRSWQITNTFEF